MARSYRQTQHQAQQLALDTGYTALYIRVSTEKQADEGFSLEAQEKALRAFCEAHGWPVSDEHVYIDAGVSGKTSERPRFKEMLQAAKAGQVRRIVAMKLDRLARNVRDFLATVDLLKDSGCALVLIKESFDTSTPHGKFALTMFAAMAELEASTITERVLSGKRQKATTGGYNGSRIPMGYSYQGGAFNVNEAQAPTVRRIFDLFNAGHSLNAIARQLNEDGTPTATGKVGAWDTKGISHILRNGLYAGVAQWAGVEVELTKHPAIITKEIYDEAQRLIKSRKPRQRVDLNRAA
jgi:site-specific DNA recombinase